VLIVGKRSGDGSNCNGREALGYRNGLDLVIKFVLDCTMRCN
jgi:hypothetical protein